MDERSIAWMIGGGSRTLRPDELVQATHRRALREAQAARHAESRFAPDWRGAISSLFSRTEGTTTAPTLDCCPA